MGVDSSEKGANELVVTLVGNLEVGQHCTNVERCCKLERGSKGMIFNDL